MLPTVLYLDIDDVLIEWNGRFPRRAAGARAFLLWAIRTFEVRWLTYWCPTGELPQERAQQLGRILGVPIDVLTSIKGIDWSGPMDKAHGIDWLEHRAGRPFIWVEDRSPVNDNLRAGLERAGWADRWIECDSTMYNGQLRDVHVQLMSDDRNLLCRGGN